MQTPPRSRRSVRRDAPPMPAQSATFPAFGPSNGVPRSPLWHWTDAIGIVITLTLAAVLLHRGGAPAFSWPCVMLYAIVTPALVRIDFREHRLPNLLTVPPLVLSFLVVVAAALFGDRVPLLLTLGVAGALAAASMFAGLGFGDVKLGTGLAAALALAGPLLPGIALVAAVLSGGVASFAALCARERAIAFGPFLCFGAVVSLVLVH
ncbi:prepilin peptidase [Humidisolicoccus flavus]|uniref:prepilin peptidase n=1 Tax=Humidisolicoccus flavus TaxID=3111414 RepID=UPI0032510EF1